MKNMNPRERVLALLVGSLVVLMGGFYAFRKVEGSFKQRAQALERLQNEKRQKTRQVQAGMIAQQQLERYQERSLPPDLQQARQLYTDWLLSVVTKIGFAEPKVNPVTGGLRSQTDAFTAHAFSVSGSGSLEMLTRLLYQFYSVDYLHRIKSLQITPRDPKTVSFAMTVEALSLPDAPERDSLHHPPSKRLAESDVQSYIDAICGRNMFGPPNSPPTLSVSSVSGQTGREVTLSPSARDPDKDDRLTFSWESKDVTGARFDPQTGRLSWTPRRPGEYTVTLIVKDDGVPVRSVQKEVKITVTDPPAPVFVAPPPPPPPAEKKPPYDQVRFTYVNGITEVDGRRQVWMIDRRTGKSYWLYEGDSFQVGDFRAEVKHIGELDVEFEWYGRRAVTPLGENLTENKELEEGELFNVRREDNPF